MKTITYYMDRPITELTREELIEALQHASKEIDRLYKSNERERKFLFEAFIRPSLKQQEGISK